jgi:anaerobic magnesium-protoporphyrin IX monomethyl ester cyclase
MKAFLLFPPQWTPFYPYLSLPSLTAFLREKGVEVEQRDVNIETYTYLLQRSFLEQVADKIEGELLKMNRYDKLSNRDERKYISLATAAIAAPKLIDTIDAAIVTMKDPVIFYDPNECLKAFRTIQSVLEFISVGYYPSRISLYDFALCGQSRSVTDLLGLADDAIVNPFLGIFLERILPELLQSKPDIVGISIAGTSQLLGALTLASLTRKSQPEIHICLGGNIPTRLYDVLTGKNSLFSLIDSIIVFEGETPLTKLVQQIECGGSLDEVPNLIYKKGETIKYSPIRSYEDINTLPPPCFDGFPLKKYLLPEVVLPVLSSRGCPWGRCTFCDVNFAYSNHFRARDSTIVIKDILNMAQHNNSRFFIFSDSEISPQRLNSLAGGVKTSGIDLRWGANSRLHDQFTKGFFDSLHLGGCEMLYFGLESASDRITNLMQKGTHPMSSERICRDSTDAGILNHIYVQFGFPSETDKEAEETIDFVLTHQDVFHSVGVAAFQLCKYSKIMRLPELYGIKVQIEPNEDATTDHAYNVEVGLSQAQARSMELRLVRQLQELGGRTDLSMYLPLEALLLYKVYYGTLAKTLKALKVEYVNCEIIPDLKEVNLHEAFPMVSSEVYIKRVSFDIEQLSRNLLMGDGQSVTSSHSYLVFDSKTLKFICVNEIGFEILTLCDGQRRFDKVIELVLSRYDLCASEEEVIDFFQLLVTYNMIELSPKPILTSS